MYSRSAAFSNPVTARVKTRKTLMSNSIVLLTVLCTSGLIQPHNLRQNVEQDVVRKQTIVLSLSESHSHSSSGTNEAASFKPTA
jgi:hypothetical protein